jgi:hypothetical protein
VCPELGSADESKKKKAQGNDVYSKNGGAQGLKNDNKEQSLYSKNEESRGGVSASKKPKLHWGYSSLTLLSLQEKCFCHCKIFCYWNIGCMLVAIFSATPSITEVFYRV